MTALDCSPFVLGIAITEFKQCTKCHEWQTKDQFCIDRSRKDGMQMHCKSCQRAYREANAETIRQKRRDYHRQNAEAISTKGRLWRITNRERLQRSKREYAIAHADEIAVYHRNWRLANQATLREKRTAYEQTDAFKTAHNAANHRRKALKLRANGAHTKADVEQIRRGQTDRQGRVRCWWCGKVMTHWHVDHKIALVKGGSNGPGNLCLACQTCNTSKKDKAPGDWAGRLL